MPRLIPCPRPTLPSRAADGHKGSFGKVLIIGGSTGMSGAVCLTSVAALRSGSGLVTAAVPRAIQPIVASYEPCVMTVGLDVDAAGELLNPVEQVIADLVAGRDAIAIGPGLGQRPEAGRLLQLVMEHADCPLVIDADALNLIALGALSKQWLPRGPCVMTPHPGEFSRLTGRSTAEIAANREALAAEFARERNVVVVLKGPGTVVTDGTRVHRNTTGNAGMATGGSGDVLAGIITSLLGQGMPVLEAAALAVHAHGLAGDIAAERFTQRGMIASDLLPCLPDAWQRLASGGPA